MWTALESTGQPEVEQSKTPLPASSNIGTETLTTERSRQSADGNKELTDASDRKRRVARLGTPAWREAHRKVVAKA